MKAIAVIKRIAIRVAVDALVLFVMAYAWAVYLAHQPHFKWIETAFV